MPTEKVPHLASSRDQHGLQCPSPVHRSKRVILCLAESQASNSFVEKETFAYMESTPEAAHCGVADADIFRKMQEHSQGDLILEEDDGPDC